jgi:hypothetical protein
MQSNGVCGTWGRVALDLTYVNHCLGLFMLSFLRIVQALSTILVVTLGTL